MTPELTDQALPERLPSWGVLVLESHHSPRFTMEWRTHPFLKLVYVLSGQGTFHLGAKTDNFFAGDVVVVTPGTRNRIEDDPASASSLYVCCISSTLLQFDPDLMSRLTSRVLRGDGRFANRVALTLRRMVHARDADNDSRPIAMVGDAMKLLHAVYEQGQESNANDEEPDDDREVIQRYVDALPNHFYEETSIDAAASQLGVPRRTFTKVFTELTGETWLQCVRRLAVEHAQRKLEQTDLPITSVAFECGFNDLSTFYRQFKKQCGVSPGEYRSRINSV